MNMHISIVLCCGVKRYCLPTIYQIIGVISLNPTCSSSFTYPNVQVRELHKHACLIVIWTEVVYPKASCLQMPIPCASPNSISLPGFICACTSVSEIHESNQKKKRNNSEHGYFEFDTYP